MFTSLYIAGFPLLSSNITSSIMLGAINSLSLSHFYNALVYCRRSIVGDTVFKKD